MSPTVEHIKYFLYGQILTVEEALEILECVKQCLDPKDVVRFEELIHDTE